MCAGQPIVVPEWIEACDAAGEWVDARQYLLKDRAAEARDGFSLAAVHEAAQRRRLLDGIDVFLTPGTSLLGTTVQVAWLHGATAVPS